MDQIKVNELIKLNSDYCAGSSNSILYKCSLLGPFIVYCCETDFTELDKQSVYNSYAEWLDICDDSQIELIDSLIELYTYKNINKKSVRFYEEFTPLFERMVDFLLGKISWTPPTDQHLAAVRYSNNLTAQVLSNIYINS